MNRANVQGEYRTQALIFAVGVHVLFALVLVFGVAWHAKPPQRYEAELWTDLPQPAAVVRPPVPPPPRPEPIKAVPPKPVVVTSPPKALPTPPAADIALKQKKVREQQAEQLRLEKLAAQKELKDAEAQRAEEARIEQLQVLQAARAEEARIKQLQAARAEKTAAEQSAKKTELQHYTDAIIDKIKSNIRVPDNVSKGTVLQVKITVLPDGSVLEPIRIVIPSGNKSYDDAALQGIMRSQPLPLPADPALRRDMRDLLLLINYEK